jgi:hypothetical protein
VMVLQAASDTALSPMAAAAIAPRQAQSERGPMTDIVPDILLAATSADGDHVASNNHPGRRPG